MLVSAKVILPERVNPTDSDREVMQLLEAMKLSEHQLYDYSDNSGRKLCWRPGIELSLPIRQHAQFIKRFLSGVILVTGSQGSGKDLFAHYVAWWAKYLFADRKILLSDRPRPLFGLYIPFDEDFLKMELGRVAKEANIKHFDVEEPITTQNKKRYAEVERVVEKWAQSTAGNHYLVNSILVLSELKRWLHNRKPGNPIGIAIGHLVTQYRHYNMSIIGTTVDQEEIDVKGFLRSVTHWVKCSWDATLQESWINIQQVKWMSGGGMEYRSVFPERFWLDGKKTYAVLGGQSFYDIYNSSNLPSMAPAKVL